MKFHQLRALIAVSETGSMHDACRALHVSQPAVSKALADLEIELSVPLLVRSPRGVTLTSYGQSLVRHARAVEHELNNAREDIEVLRGSSGGTLTIGVTPVTALGPFAGVIRRFAIKFPDIRIHVLELRPAQIEERLMDGTIDFALMSRIGEPVKSRFYWELLYSTTNYLAVRTGNKLAQARSLQTLVNERWLSFDTPDDPTSFLGTTFDMHSMKPPQSVLRCMSTGLYMELAVTTDLISTWGQPAFGLRSLEGQLTRLQLKESLPDISVGLVCRDIELVTKISNSCIDMIRNACCALNEKSGQPPLRPGKGVSLPK